MFSRFCRFIFSIYDLDSIFAFCCSLMMDNAEKEKNIQVEDTGSNDGPAYDPAEVQDDRMTFTAFLAIVV